MEFGDFCEEENLEKTGVDTGLTCDKDKSHEKITKLSVYKNLTVIIMSFLLLFAAYTSLENLQSSLNVAEGLGTSGLTVVYGSKLASSLFLPPLLFSKLGIKWTMVISVFGYIGYIAASFRATWVTVIPSSVLLGLGASNLWTGLMASLSELARQYSSLTQQERRNVLTKFFSIFYTVFYTGDIWGNLVSSLVFSYKRADNITEHNSTCGASFCSRVESKNSKLLVKDPIKIYIYSGFCLGCAVVSLLLMVLLFDALKPSNTEKISSKKLLTSVVRQFWNSGYQKILILTNMYRGLAQSFMASDFNAAFTSCSLGVENVGFLMICYALCCSTSSFLHGRLARMTGFYISFIITFITHGAVIISLLLWKPSADKYYVFYIFAALWGVGVSAYSTILAPLYSHVFPNRTATASACYDLLSSTGSVLTFGLSTFLCTFDKLVIILVWLMLSTACVLTVIFHDKNSRLLKT